MISHFASFFCTVKRPFCFYALVSFNSVSKAQKLTLMFGTGWTLNSQGAVKKKVAADRLTSADSTDGSRRTETILKQSLHITHANEEFGSVCRPVIAFHLRQIIYGTSGMTYYLRPKYLTDFSVMAYMYPLRPNFRGLSFLTCITYGLSFMAYHWWAYHSCTVLFLPLCYKRHSKKGFLNRAPLGHRHRWIVRQVRMNTWHTLIECPPPTHPGCRSIWPWVDYPSIYSLKLNYKGETKNRVFTLCIGFTVRWFILPWEVRMAVDLQHKSTFQTLQSLFDGISAGLLWQRRCKGVV